MRFILVLTFYVLLAHPNTSSANLDTKTLEQTVERALSTFYTPGMSVAIVQNGELIYSNGFGFANLATETKVNDKTYFRLASTSKAFTSAALAILVEQEKLQWTDLVIDHMPEFRLKNAHATMHFTVADLLTHKSGLIGGAGDSMIWPEPSGFTRDEVIHNLRHLTPSSDFRQQFAYSNVLYITAGELVAKVSGLSFEDFVEQNVFAPLGMDCYAGKVPEKASAIGAMGYAHSDDRGIYSVPRNAITTEGLMSAAAGGMVCNAHNMAKWIKALLAREQLPFSEKSLEQMWAPHTILRVAKIEREWQGTHSKNYGLGWRTRNIKGYQQISHTGTLSGYQAYIALLPELDVGVIVLNNGSNYGARASVMNAIMEMYTSDTQSDWVDRYIGYQAEREAIYLANNKTPVAKAPLALPSDKILGLYEDVWFGQFSITESENTLRIDFPRKLHLSGTLEGFQDFSYKVVFDNQNASGNAFIHFDLDTESNVRSARLYPFTSRKTNNHAWRDMHFMKRNKAQ